MSDPRVTPARKDLAAAHLKGKVEAARFAEGTLYTAARGRAPLRLEPGVDARIDTELLFGERFMAYEIANGWAWGQSLLDEYVGYVAAEDLCAPDAAPDHRVTFPMTPLLPAPDFKRPPRDMLPMNAKVKVVAHDGRFVRIAPDGYVFAGHIAPIATRAADWVAVAEQFRGVVYLWAGKTAAGIDCSGLIQTSLEAGGIAALRDADMQEAALGNPLEIRSDLSGLRRGDLVFWKDHVGVMLDAANVLHANTFYMAAVVEPLTVAVARIAGGAGPITSIKRL